MKHYSEEVISKLQDAIDMENCTIKKFENYDDFPKSIYINGVRVDLVHTTNYDAINNYDFAFNRKDYEQWKVESLGKFYGKDWKRNNKDIETLSKYREVKLSVGDISVIAFLRMIEEDEFDNSTDNMYDYEYYTDIIIDNCAYTLIKSFSPSINETYSTASTLEDKNVAEKIITMYGDVLNVDDLYNRDLKDLNDDEMDFVSLNEVEDDMQSIELF